MQGIEQLEQAFLPLQLTRQYLHIVKHQEPEGIQALEAVRTVCQQLRQRQIHGVRTVVAERLQQVALAGTGKAPEKTELVLTLPEALQVLQQHCIGGRGAEAGKIQFFPEGKSEGKLKGGTHRVRDPAIDSGD
jgi:hypothetical protein